MVSGSIVFKICTGVPTEVALPFRKRFILIVLFFLLCILQSNLWIPLCMSSNYIKRHPIILQKKSALNIKPHDNVQMLINALGAQKLVLLNMACWHISRWKSNQSGVKPATSKENRFIVALRQPRIWAMLLISDEHTLCHVICSWILIWCLRYFGMDTDNSTRIWRVLYN